jgi:hypothetical protein
MFDRSAKSGMTPEAFASLGEKQVAYIKAIRSEQVAFLSAEAPVLAPGHLVFVLFSAEGKPIVLADDHDDAAGGAENLELETVSLH